MPVCLDIVPLLKVEGFFDMVNTAHEKCAAGETISDKNINTLYFDLSVTFPRY